RPAAGEFGAGPRVRVHPETWRRDLRDARARATLDEALAWPGIEDARPTPPGGLHPHLAPEIVDLPLQGNHTLDEPNQYRPQLLVLAARHVGARPAFVFSPFCGPSVSHVTQWLEEPGEPGLYGRRAAR